MKENSYNGWANYATWNVSLWIYNDEILYHELSDKQRVMKRREETWTEDSAMEFISSLFNGKTPDDVRLDSREIEWEEIAASLNEDLLY